MDAVQKKNFLKIVIIGDSNVGKTSLLQRYTLGDMPDPKNTKATIGADFQKKEVTVNNVSVTVQIWDTAGQEQYHALGHAFYRGADCCCLVFDLTKKESLEHLNRWRQGFIDNTGCEPDTFPFVVMGNKADMTD